MAKGKIRMLRKAPKQDRRPLTKLSKLESGAVQIAAEAQHVKAVTRWRRWASGRGDVLADSTGGRICRELHDRAVCPRPCRRMRASRSPRTSNVWCKISTDAAQRVCRVRGEH